MCGKCLQNAEIDALKAQSVLALAEAAAHLARDVPGSENAVAAINARLEAMVRVPKGEPESKTDGAVPAPEAKLPPELQRLQDLFERLGIKGKFVDIDFNNPKL